MEGENLVEKIDKSGFEEVKTLTSDVPTLLDYKDFNYDSCSLIELLGIVAWKTKKILRTRNDLSMEMHSNEGESVSTYPCRL